MHVSGYAWRTAVAATVAMTVLGPIPLPVGNILLTVVLPVAIWLVVQLNTDRVVVTLSEVGYSRRYKSSIRDHCSR